jgi:hypothetical protein
MFGYRAVGPIMDDRRPINLILISELLGRIGLLRILGRSEIRALALPLLRVGLAGGTL